MPERLESALSHARSLVTEHDTGPIEKTTWRSPAGKERLSARLYVELFPGRGAVLFAKEPSRLKSSRTPIPRSPRPIGCLAVLRDPGCRSGEQLAYTHNLRGLRD